MKKIILGTVATVMITLTFTGCDMFMSKEEKMAKDIQVKKIIREEEDRKKFNKMMHKHSDPNVNPEDFLPGGKHWKE